MSESMSESMLEDIIEAIRNAKSNGYYVDSMSSLELANDLIECDVRFENVDRTELIDAVHKVRSLCPKCNGSGNVND